MDALTKNLMGKWVCDQSSDYYDEQREQDNGNITHKLLGYISVLDAGLRTL